MEWKKETGLSRTTFPFPFDLGNRLAEVYVDPSVINQHIVHFEISLLTVFLL